MISPRDWHEEDIVSLVRNGEKESLTLEYKSCGALQKQDDKKKEEISKDVSAFANAAGGTIVYGVMEDKDKHLPTRLDAGFEPGDISKEWLEQVINSTIHPRLGEFYINQVELPTTAPGKVLYVVEIPQSVTTPPHQAKDHRYYKRYNFQVLPMEDYEIRDVMNRSRVPDLNIEVNRVPCPYDGSGGVRLSLTIWNRGQATAIYVACACEVMEESYFISSTTVTYQPGRWTLRDGRSAQFIPKMDSVVHPELPFDAGFIELSFNTHAGTIPPQIQVEFSLYAEGIPRKRIRLSDIPTGLPAKYHYP